MAVLRAESISKRYANAPAPALDRVSIEFEAGAIHALLGENGAGKSTLVSIVGGLIDADAGSLTLDGAPYRPRSPREARARGVGLVHQHDTLIRELTVAENLELTRARGQRWLSRADVVARARADAERVGLELPDPARLAGALSVGERQRVELIGVLAASPKVVLFDEPTAVLTPAEADALLATLRRLAQAGAAVVLITHRLAEVTACADRVTVLRRGQVVADVAARELDEAGLAHAMVGELPQASRGAGRTRGAVTLALEHVDVDTGSSSLRAASLEVAAGEIVGVAGVDGNGQRALFEVVAGLTSQSRGRVTWDGVDVARDDVDARRDRGLGIVAEDRRREGVIGTFSIEDALLLSTSALDTAIDAGAWSKVRVRERATAAIARFGIAAQDARATCSSLSGGHQQRVVLARELAGRPRVLLVHNPTRGLDVRAARFVRDTVLAFAADGGAVLWIGSDLDELVPLCDRLHVLHRGTLSASLPAGTPSATIGRLMAGGAP
ncbi:MAG: ATP-binding cassette domain-containing protein [Planctomycetes bacterium]|nr:ATP-binding cassette domain-containing protein [Planctomycetota bacterium]MCC7171833.1 ATP-binding cassette domain-containing protein [Planctomycetota bacterium]